MLSTASLLPESQENTFSLFTTANSTNFASYHFNSSSSVFQDPKACYCFSSHKRHISYLSRQSTHCRRDIHRLSEPYETSNFSFGVPGFSNQLRKIHNNPHPKARILGRHDRLNLYVSRPPSRENPVNKIVSPKASENKRNHFNNFISRFIGLCTSAKYAVPQAPLHYRSLQFLRNPVLTLLPMAFSAFFNYGGGGTFWPAPQKTQLG